MFNIDGDFPGGNILIEKIEGDDVFLKQDLRDTEGWWFYWAFRIRGASGRRLNFHFTHGDVIGAQGPAINAGQAWTWLGADSVQRDPAEKGVQFSVRIPSELCHFCFCIPYLQAELQGFLSRHPDVQSSQLCLSEAGRPVELLTLGPAQARQRVLLTSRHHACEAMANFVVEGLLEAALDPGPPGDWWRRNVQIAWIPFMDKDGVERGDQGKNRRPHDHNRDYDKERYASVRALKAWAGAWGQGRIAAAFDFHCPYIRGKRDQLIHFASTPHEVMNKHMADFCSSLQKNISGPLRFETADNQPFEGDLNRLDTGGSCCQEWMETLEGVQLASTVEFPYDLVRGGPVSVAAARAFGRDLAGELQRQLGLPS